MVSAAIILIFALACLAGGFVAGVYAEKYHGVPMWEVEDQWSIGIFVGDSPLRVAQPDNIRNPVLTAKDVTDVRASFVADPFMLHEGGKWYMFFEVMPADSYHGKIATATSSDGLRWQYQGIVLDEPYHLSYPYVFRWQNECYMIPDCYKAGVIRLYRAVDFPMRWELVQELLEGSYVDASILHYQDRWWMFAADVQRNNTLRLFSADTFLSPWSEHPDSPIVAGNAHIARPGGRVLMFDGRIIRYTQDDEPNYGNQLRAFEIIELTATSYHERQATPDSILTASGAGWNRDGMHHIDPHQIGDQRWIACVDGNRQRSAASVAAKRFLRSVFSRSGRRRQS